MQQNQQNYDPNPDPNPDANPDANPDPNPLLYKDENQKDIYFLSL